MSASDECCVLIPASTLEDFPADLDDRNARSLLAGWTVLWHPELLVRAGQMPVWYRADAPPEPVAEPDSADASKPFAGRVIATPIPSIEQLPAGYAERAQACGAQWITGESRDQMAESAGLTISPDQSHQGRTIGVADFYAAGFAALQIQIMTRRLRYTSNLDQIYLETRLVEAAKAFLESRTAESIEALHDVFDALSEERDHYFTSDPHLIDLTLITSTTLDSSLDELSELPDALAGGAGKPEDHDAVGNTTNPGVLPTPANVLIDAEAVEQLGQRVKQNDESAIRLRDALSSDGTSSGSLGWAAGGPAAGVAFDALDYAAASRAIIDSHRATTACIGAAPAVYARFTGGTPSDLIDVIAGLGYRGFIPIDFAAGTGYGDEAKVVFPIASGDIEALTAKPIDAASDSAFLSIGAKLGEAIDGGEIATGLLVHWPGHVCDSFRDLKRLASWSVSMGRFWNLKEYFVSGERPYHQGTLAAPADAAGHLLSESVLAEKSDPISSLARPFCEATRKRRDAVLSGMAQLVRGQTIDDSSAESATRLISESIGGGELNANKEGGEAKLLINSHSSPTRVMTTLPRSPRSDSHVFAVSRGDDGFDVSVDVPACGFAWVGAIDSGATDKRYQNQSDSRDGSPGVGRWLRDKFLGKPATIAHDHRLHNEFMEVSISEESGGIAGVYSGSVRGNRFSMRLFAAGCGDQPEMKSDRCEVVRSTAAIGQLKTSGKVIAGGKDDRKPIAEFTMLYTLHRGSRIIEVTGSLNPLVSLGEKPWQNYLAARAAVSQEAAICRPILRDKLHRMSGRRIVAPLGLLIDEPERKTLISSDGYAFHRVVEERFFDTLLSVRGETSTEFSLRYGFDVPSPVSMAQRLIAGPIQHALTAQSPTTPSGWLVHVSPRDVLVSDLKIHRLADGKLAAEILLIQTQPKSCRTKLRLCRNVSDAYQVETDVAELIESLKTEPQSSSESSPTKPTRLKCEQDAIEVPLSSLGVNHVLAILS